MIKAKINKGWFKKGNHSKTQFKEGEQKGNENYNWKGGRKKNPQSYILIWKPEHPYSMKGGYIFEHRLVMEKKLGRFLKPGEIVHHINGDPSDNKIKNLQLFESNSKHRKFHSLSLIRMIPS